VAELLTENTFKEITPTVFNCVIKKRKWSWIGHTLRKPSGIIEKDALDWNPQGKGRRDRPKKTWKRTVEEARD
jgi:hypothetical protein